jgi:hypothetical protein
MKKPILFCMLLLVFIIGTSATISSCSSKGDKPEQTNGEIPATEETDTEVSFACPMHPEITGKEGDTCSKCGMALEKVEEEEENGHEDDHDHESDNH